MRVEKTYVVPQACHYYFLLSQFLHMIDTNWKLKPQAPAAVSGVPQAHRPTSLSSHVDVLIKPVDAGDIVRFVHLACVPVALSFRDDDCTIRASCNEYG